MSRRVVVFGLVLIAGLFGLNPIASSGVPARAEGTRSLERVTVCLQWVHQAQFAGFYVAQDEGLYRKYGLAVKLRAGGPGLDPLDDLGHGRCHFASAWLSEGMARRAQGLEVVHLAQVIQRSALLLVAFKKSGITRLTDLAGRRVGLWPPPFAWPARSLLARSKLKVRIILQGVTMEPLLRGAVEAATAMLYNEYHQLFQAGVDPGELTVFRLADLGLNFPEDGLYARRSLWRSRPGLCRRFVAATLAGWRRAAVHPDRALRSVMRRVDRSLRPSNSAHQNWMLRTVLRLIKPRGGDRFMGRLDLAAYRLVHRVLVRRGVISTPVPAADFVTSAWKSK